MNPEVLQSGSPERKRAKERLTRFVAGLTMLLAVGIVLTIWDFSSSTVGQQAAGRRSLTLSTAGRVPAKAEDSQGTLPVRQARHGTPSVSDPDPGRRPVLLGPDKADGTDHGEGALPLPAAMSARDAAWSLMQANPGNPSMNNLPTQPSGVGPTRASDGSISGAGINALHGNGGLHRP